MKAFFTWLGLQCVFARILFGLSVELWKALRFANGDGIGYFIIPAVMVCLCETIVSGVILADMLKRNHTEDHEFRKLEFYASHPELKARGY